jgi:hypothetical protein
MIFAKISFIKEYLSLEQVALGGHYIKFFFLIFFYKNLR